MQQINASLFVCYDLVQAGKRFSPTRLALIDFLGFSVKNDGEKFVVGSSYFVTPSEAEESEFTLSALRA